MVEHYLETSKETIIPRIITFGEKLRNILESMPKKKVYKPKPIYYNKVKDHLHLNSKNEIVGLDKIKSNSVSKL